MTDSEFRPAPWLRGGHAQTIVPSILPARPLRGKGETFNVRVAPGTSLRVVAHRPEAPARGTLVAIHGLAGSAESRYMRRTAAQALARRWAVVRVNLRNCGGTEALASTLYNAGQHGDADAVLAALEDRGWPRPVALVGFSLGGNIVAKYSGISGASCRADAVCGINAPVDLSVCIAALERRGNALYHAYFTRELCVQVRRIRRVRPVAGPDATARAVGGVRGFDDRFTAPDAGYADAAAYYAAASAGPLLSGARRPTLIVSADDDPFVPVSAFDPFRRSGPHVAIVHPRGGGHCGYWSSEHPHFWAAGAALAFFERTLRAGGA